MGATCIQGAKMHAAIWAESSETLERVLGCGSARELGHNLLLDHLLVSWVVAVQLVARNIIELRHDDHLCVSVRKAKVRVHRKLSDRRDLRS
ncbi:unannotated protein [freshwater metagenome]|uniref:Unannotated protein n=1 Tax=freshwater metagenome TaxID=449393 RepID=A0A6J7ULW4_9ZZZZ